MCFQRRFSVPSDRWGHSKRRNGSQCLTSVRTASSDHTARLWDMSTGETVRQYNGHQKGPGNLFECGLAYANSSHQRRSVVRCMTGQARFVPRSPRVSSMQGLCAVVDGLFVPVSFCEGMKDLIWQVIFWLRFSGRGSVSVCLREQFHDTSRQTRPETSSRMHLNTSCSRPGQRRIFRCTQVRGY